MTVHIKTLDFTMYLIIILVWYNCVILVDKWEAVCDYRWDCSESIIACKQLGYQNLSETGI